MICVNLLIRYNRDFGHLLARYIQDFSLVRQRYTKPCFLISFLLSLYFLTHPIHVLFRKSSLVFEICEVHANRSYIQRFLHLCFAWEGLRKEKILAEKYTKLSSVLSDLLPELSFQFWILFFFWSHLQLWFFACADSKKN